MNLTRLVDCLEGSLCDEIVASSWDYARSTVLSEDGPGVEDKIRTNDMATLVGHLEQQVHQGLNNALLEWSTQIKEEFPEDIVRTMYLPGVRPDFDTFREPICILRYAKGQQYKWHVDAPEERYYANKYTAHSRCISVVVYLNEDFEGGETEMPGLKYTPKKGKALIFPSNWNYPHRACPVKKGTKYALVTWFHPLD